jgi:serine/threonine-protein kinase
MEYVDGSDLKAVLEHQQANNRKIPVPLAMYIACRICEGLSYAHEARDNRDRLLGIVHRDISPPNVLLTRHGEIKVVDFGLAKANSQLERSEPGIIKGKFSYLSPEAALGESVDLRTDLFAVGVILWEMLAGRRLFLGETDLQTVRLVQAAEIPDIRRFNPDVTPQIDAVVRRSLARDPRQRYQSARDMGIELNRVMFTLGVAVSPFDLAVLVTEVAKERQKKKDKAKTSIIGTLIEDAMMEFTSLEENGKSNKSFQTLHSTTSSLASRPLDTFEDVQDWAADLNVEPAASTGSPFAAGNLAGLEDHPPGRPLQPTLPPMTKAELLVRIPNAQPGFPPAAVNLPSTPMAQPIPQSVAQTPTASGVTTTSQKPMSGAVKALVAALVVAAAVAGSYVSGLL